MQRRLTHLPPVVCYVICSVSLSLNVEMRLKLHRVRMTLCGPTCKECVYGGAPLQG